MPPIVIYAICAAVMIGFSLAIYINRYYSTRKCHACGAQVEIGRSKCQACTYRFIN